jgi:carbon-monoxide dehydrogenase medium subunit
MTLPDLNHHRPATLAEARRLGEQFGAEGRFLAGGTELLVDLRSGREKAAELISLRGIPELNEIRKGDDGLHIGAMTTLAEVAASAEVGQACPALTEAVLAMGGTQIRNQATVGGNFCRAVPCADTPPICIAAGAKLRLLGEGGEREVAAESFCLAPRQTVLASGEMLTEIILPPLPAATGTSYQRFSLRGGMALAVAAVAVVLRRDGRKIGSARLVLNAVAPVPLLVPGAADLLVGQEPTPDLLAGAGRKAAAAAQPITDLRATAQYRRELVEVLTVRAVRQAYDRAQPTPQGKGSR